MKKRNSLLGIIMIFIGSILVTLQISDMNLLSFSNFWPLFILIPGIMLELSFFSLKKDPATLVLGGIFTTTGLLFIFQTSTNWQYSTEPWSIYTFSLAIGLFQYYLFIFKEKQIFTILYIFTILCVYIFFCNKLFRKSLYLAYLWIIASLPSYSYIYIL